jgi:hypothetical protein
MSGPDLKLDVTIRRVADGATRVYRDAHAYVESWRFQWSEGNYGCDCNREIFFYRRRRPENESCGEAAYAVDRIVNADTGEVLCEGDPRDG